MRKSMLVKKTVELIDELNSLQHKIDALKRENAELKEKITELENQKTLCAAETAPQEEEGGFTVYNEEIREEAVPAEPIELPTENDVIEYGAIAIGRVVQESVKYANLISESNSENRKELLNLIMGMAEVTKAEIFSITDGEMAFELKKELIDTQCDEAIDYFKSAYGQITE